MTRALMLLALWLFAGAAQAAPVLCVGSWCLSPAAFNLLLHNAQVREPDLTPATFKQQLADVRLLASYARTQHFAAAGDPFGVGFSPKVKLERERYSLFQRQLNTAFNAYAKAHLGDNGLNAFLTAPIHDHGLDIDSALRADNRKAIGMTAKQLAAAHKIVLARFGFPPDAAQQFTLAALYAEQNVQGRLALQQQGASVIRAAVHARIKQQYFYWWLAHHSGLTEADITHVGEALADRQINNEWLEHQGLVEVMHDHASSRLEEVASQVSQQQVAAWYQQHKNNFRITNSVQAQHLACANEVDCKAGRALLIKGEKPAEVAKRYASKTQQQSTDLGELSRVKDGMRWITSLAMLQQPGEFSRPVRAPDGHWEVVWVSSRETGFLPADSSSVRYQASRAIARAQLLAEHQQLMAKLRQHSKVVTP